MPIISLFNMTSYSGLKYNDEIKKYINITMTQESYDTSTGQTLYTTSGIELKTCEGSDL